MPNTFCPCTMSLSVTVFRERGAAHQIPADHNYHKGDIGRRVMAGQGFTQNGNILDNRNIPVGDTRTADIGGRTLVPRESAQEHDGCTIGEGADGDTGQNHIGAHYDMEIAHEDTHDNAYQHTAENGEPQAAGIVADRNAGQRGHRHRAVNRDVDHAAAPYDQRGKDQRCGDTDDGIDKIGGEEIAPDPCHCSALLSGCFCASSIMPTH